MKFLLFANVWLVITVVIGATVTNTCNQVEQCKEGFRCQCVPCTPCVQKEQCKKDTMWDATQCKCVPKKPCIQTKKCINGQKWNPKLCKCVNVKASVKDCDDCNWEPFLEV